MENIEVVNTDLTWMQYLTQCNESKQHLTKYKSNLDESIRIDNNDNDSLVQKQLANSMINELNENIDNAKKRLLYDFNSYKDDDLKASKLTEREIQVLKLRMIHNRCSTVAEILGIDPRSAFESFKKGLDKIKKYQTMKAQGQGDLNLLSEQQKIILDFVQKGYKNKIIADELNISNSVVKTQKSRIKKLGFL